MEARSLDGDGLPLLHKTQSLLRLRDHPVAGFEEGEGEIGELHHGEEKETPRSDRGGVDGVMRDHQGERV